MGLFDTVRCQMPLPVEWPTDEFQTKQLGCQGDRYTIAPHGVLVKAGHDFGFDSGGYRIGDMRVPIDGAFEFYDVHPKRGWLTLKASFVSGICRRVEFVDWIPYPNQPDQKPPEKRP